MIPIHRLWMYDMHHDQGRGIKPEYFYRVDAFVAHVFNMEPFKSQGLCRYPYSKCRLTKFLNAEDLTSHLYRYDFKPRYWV